MFISNAGFHPGISAKKASTRLRKFSSTIRYSISSSPSPPRSPSVSQITNSCELWLLNVLQGIPTSSNDRLAVIQEIDEMDDDRKEQIIDFLQAKDGAAQCAIENNACKVYQCQSSDLTENTVSNKPELMLSMWNHLHEQIIPTLQSTLYHLKRHRSSFDIRNAVISAFRDRVLCKVVSPSRRVAEWEGMLFTILLETDSNTSEHTKFSALVNCESNCLGSQPSRSPVVKARSKTLPNKPRKSVTWQDMRKSATFSI